MNAQIKKQYFLLGKGKQDFFSNVRESITKKLDSYTLTSKIFFSYPISTYFTKLFTLDIYNYIWLDNTEFKMPKMMCWNYMQL